MDTSLEEGGLRRLAGGRIGTEVRRALRLGVLRVGDQLPTVKEVVERLAINPNTVLKAYKLAVKPSARYAVPSSRINAVA